MLWAVILLGVPIKLLLLVGLGLYSRLWRYASVADLERLLVGAGACAAVDVVLGLAVMPALGLIPHRLSYAVILLDACLGALAIALPRFTMRVLVRRGGTRATRPSGEPSSSVPAWRAG